MDRKDLLSLMFITVAIFASALIMPAAFSQNQTETAKSCPLRYTMVDGVCQIDEVKKYKFGNILLKMYNEHQESASSGVSGSSGSAGQLVVINILFEADDCNLPEDLGIVRKGPCDTYHERAQMAVLIPVANMYDAAALDQVTGIYPAGEIDHGEPFGPTSGVDDEPAIINRDTAELPNPTAHENTLDDEPAIINRDTAEPPSPATHENMLYYIVPVGVAAAAAAVVAMLHAKKREKIEA